MTNSLVKIFIWGNYVWGEYTPDAAEILEKYGRRQLQPTPLS